MTTDYGTDLDFDGLDLAEDGGVVSGETLLGQAALIRLSTPRGSVIDAPDDGIDLVDWLSRDMSPDEVARLQGTIEEELLKDERFIAARAVVDVTELLTAGTMRVELELDGGPGPFRLVLGVSAAGVAILGGA